MACRLAERGETAYCSMLIDEQAVLTYHDSYLTLFDWHYAVVEQAFSDRKYRWLPHFQARAPYPPRVPNADPPALR